MDAAMQQLQTLLDLDARHDDLLRRLEELDKRVAEVLAECMAPEKPVEVVPPAVVEPVPAVPSQRHAA